MTVTFTTVDENGIVHHRSTFAKEQACPAPDWVAQIGSAGGEHNIATCRQCWVSAIVSARQQASGVAEKWAQDDERHYALVSAERPPAYRLSGRELDYLTSRQADRIRRRATHSPLRRLPSVLRELRLMANVTARQCQTTGLSEEQRRLSVLRYYVIQQAASAAWERLKAACEDRSIAYRLRRYVPAAEPYVPTWE